MIGNLAKVLVFVFAAYLCYILGHVAFHVVGWMARSLGTVLVLGAIGYLLFWRK